ncbi:hypothetical protein FIBSPDRAFT_1049718 [Athelia psychrophila]|uniref:CoA-dependent acyltransferase n=1 Tax=Athelia psychrophila TaxID=1759441 RepID=A0A166BVC2_9AGAM|nr:hypothetical protein FIBSPDRAFT_1049718 [Fibularhizoctonia sp. CBS 109695]
MTTTALGNHISPPPESTPSPWSWLPGPVFPNYQPAAVGGHQSVRSRKLWGSEVLFAKGALLAPGRADVIIRTTLSLPAPQKNTHERVRAALRTMRWNHPSIASHVAWDKDFVEGKFVYEAPKDETAVSHWLDQVTFLRQAGEEGVEKATDGLLSELASLSTKRTGYELKLYHVTPSSSETSGTRNREKHEIIMYFRHELFDGVGAWEAVGIYLSELAATLGAPSGTSSLEWGKELERLARPVPDRAGPAAQWSPKDLHGDWPLIQRVKGVIARPGSDYGVPYPILPAKQSGMSYKITKFSEATSNGLLRAARVHGVKLFATQFATNLIACMRVSPPPATDEGEHRITLPYNAVSLRRNLSTLGQTELVSALGFNTLDARDLMRFKAAGDKGASNQVILDAIWTLAREIQVQLTAQAEWDKDFVKCAPVMLQTLGALFKDAPPRTHCNQTPQITNTGAVDSMVKPSYPIGSQAVMEVLNVTLHNVIFHTAVHTFAWRNELHYSYSVPAIAGAEADEKEVVGNWMRELERLTTLLAGDSKEGARVWAKL